MTGKRRRPGGHSDDRPLEAAAGLIRAGRYPAAVDLLQRRLSGNPNNAAAELLLAEALGKSGKTAQALGHARRAARLEPRNPQARILSGLLLLRQGRIAAGLEDLVEATRLAPDSSEAWVKLATALFNQGRSHKAAEAFARAVALAPESPGLRAQLASAHQADGDFAAAAQAFSAAQGLAPGHHGYRAARANALRLLGDLEAARQVLEESLRALGANGRTHELLGTLELDLGNLEAAARHYRKALELDPGEANAMFGLCRLDRPGSEDALLERIETMLEQAELGAHERASLRFSEGALHDRQGRHDEAMAAFAEGNRLKKEQLNYDLGRDTKRFAQIKAAFPTDRPAGSWRGGHPSRRPIFIVGMPRSGTTLVEQILSAHGDVSAGGELPHINHLKANWPDGPGRGAAYPEGAWDLSPDDCHGLGARYLSRTEHLLAAGSRVTDKLPLNFENLGLIARIFPKAALVHCRRGAMDTCTSNYLTLFGGRTAGYSYDLRDLAGFYKLYEDLMAHWRALGLAVHDVSYEALIADQEAESRRLLAHCELDWQDQVLDFAGRTRAVLTASNLQVRKPLYKTSVGRWRRYGAALEPLAEALSIGEETRSSHVRD